MGNHNSYSDRFGFRNREFTQCSWRPFDSTQDRLGAMRILDF
jgi:hypothetical protein